VDGASLIHPTALYGFLQLAQFAAAGAPLVDKSQIIIRRFAV